MRKMLGLGAGLVAVVLPLAACSDQNEAATVSSTATPPTTIASTDVTEVTVAATPSTTETTSTTSAPETTPMDCEAASSVAGDFDGDGTPDLAAFDAARVELVVCHGGGVATLAGSGQGEVLLAADLNDDGVDEILTGGTTAWGAGADVAAFVDGVLDFVTLPTGEQLTLWEGLPPDGFLAYGCGDFSGDGRREVAVVEGELVSAGEATWRRSIYRIEGHTAVPVASDAGTFELTGAVDVLSTSELAALRGDRC